MAVALFPQTRRALLGLLYGLPDRAFYLREIAQRVGSGMGQVQRELGRLTRAGILHRFEQGRHVFYQADRRCPAFDELRGLIAKTLAGPDHLRHALSELEDRIASIIKSIVEDNKENIWISTQKGLNMLRPQPRSEQEENYSGSHSYSIFTFGPEDGLKNMEFAEGVCLA